MAVRGNVATRQADQSFLAAEPTLAPARAAPLVRLSEVLGALSYALDLTEGQPAGHSMRCAWIAMNVGRSLAMRPDQLSDLYYTIILKDAGCSSNAARLWELYGGDERSFKHDFKAVDSQSLWQLGQFVLSHTGPGEALRARVRRVLNIAEHGDEIAGELIQTRCERGADIVRRLGFGDEVASGVYALDEHFNGRGRPSRLSGEAIPLTARIALLAQVADVFHTMGGPDAARQEVRRRSGTWFDPRVVYGFLAASQQPDFWSTLAGPDIDRRVAGMEPVGRVILVDEDRLDDIAEAFSAVIDAKSSFTAGHSERVTSYACLIAEQLDYPPARRRWLRRAALLHDIGKLGVSNSILDKPGKLDAEEWTAIKRHSELSAAILGRISVFAGMAEVAGAHHEKLDGSGYPNRLRGSEIPLESRIITVADIFDALTASRPYRGPMPVDEALAIMERDRDTALDGDCLDALKRTL